MTFSVVKLPSGEQQLNDPVAHASFNVSVVIASDVSFEEVAFALAAALALIPAEARPKFFNELGKDAAGRLFSFTPSAAGDSTRIDWSTLVASISSDPG